MELKKHIISNKATLSDTLGKLNELSSSILLLFVIDEKTKLVGTITDGDIRRGLIKKSDLSDEISTVMNTNFISSNIQRKTNTIHSIDKKDIKLLPIVNENGTLIEIVNLLAYRIDLPIEAFIMAGGEGQRLRPLTNNTPKPLLKVGDKPIIEHNIDRLKYKGINKIHISIKYLGNQLKDYFGNGSDKNIDISYLEEDEPLGTIGSVSLVENYKEDTILLMNSDLLTNVAIEDMFEEFKKKNSDLMVATVPYKVNIPYAVMETENEKVTSFKEKPTYTYQSNAGIYLFKKEIVDLIPKNKYFNATDLMEKMIELGKSVNYYPILGYWLDIGKHEDFEKAQEDIKHLKL